MRDITAHPITVEEVRTALANKREELDPDKIPMGGIDDVALSYLMNFLENKNVQLELHRFLEKAQPKRVSTGLDNLDANAIQKLLNKRGSHDHVYDLKYKGVSERGSHVYDTHRQRVFVRIVDGELRGELDEDNFATRAVDNTPLVIKSDVEEPVSGIGRLWQDLKRGW